jgi:Family of unknown function (DUF6506)
MAFMGALRKFCFVVKGPGYVPEIHRATIDSGHFSTSLVGVPSADAAVSVVRDMVSRGVQLIELCGGFTPDEAKVLEKEAQGVPIGLVTYTEAQQKRLGALFSGDGAGP